MRALLLSYLGYLQPPASCQNQYLPGKHSYRSLGSDYYVDIQVKNVADARLVLFNKELAQALKLELPDSDAELEQFILKNFAWFKQEQSQNPPENSSAEIQTFFATRYQDADDKTAGSALGDGRAVWVGELITETEPGRFHYVDVVLKGTGVTPLAWFNHPRETHRDGMVSMTDAVHEYIYSLAAKTNGIDTVGILAVIELPFVRKTDKEKAAILVRIGNHLRFAHYRYFSDNPVQLEKIFEYGLKRDMGLALEHSVTAENVQHYLDSIVNNLAHDAAVYFDVHAVHGSPTFGNRTSSGGTIDLSTFVFTDAHHSNYSYMNDGANLLGGDWGQTEQFFNLFSILIAELKSSGFKYQSEIRPVEYFLRRFRIKFEQILTRRWLIKVGLSEPEINGLSTHSKEHFYGIVKWLYEAKGSKKILLNQGKLLMAAFDPRKILSGTADCIENFDDMALIWQTLFKVDRNWGTYTLADATPYIKAYQKSVLGIINELNASEQDIAAWKQNGKKIRLAERNEPGPDFFYGSEKYFASEPVLQQISSGNASWQETTALAEASVLKLADYGLVSA